METNTRSKQLTEIFTLTRNLSNYYFGQVKNEDPHRVFKVDQTPLNNVYWLIGHLANCEEALILKQIGETDYYRDWFPMFDYGSKVPNEGEGPDFEEIFQHYELVHQVTKEKLPLFSDNLLDDKSPTGFKIGRLETISDSIMHAIRHEGCHAGHLGWLMKLYKNS